MGKLSDFRSEKVEEILTGVPFVRLGRDLLTSDAWRSMSINCRRLIDFLIIEHMSHAGRENGILIATYNQLQEQVKIPRRYINQAISEAEEKGLILVEYGARKGYADSYTNKFTLTFLKIMRVNEHGQIYYIAPSREWEKYKIPEKDKSSKLQS